MTDKDEDRTDFMPDKVEILTALAEVLLEEAGFEDVKIEAMEVPEHIKPQFCDPSIADKITYLKAQTSLGTFGVMPCRGAVAVDLTDLGLTYADLGENVEHDDDEPEDASIVLFGDPLAGTDGLAEFREFLEARKSAN